MTISLLRFARQPRSHPSRKVPVSIEQYSTVTRRAALVAAAAGCLPLAACAAGGWAKTVTLDFVLFSYLPRPIFEMLVNGRIGTSTGVYPQTGGGTVTGAEFTLGPQRVTWRWADTGQTVIAKSTPSLNRVAKDAQFLALHIYPDETVEFLTSRHYPQPSPRGEIEILKMGGRRGK